MPRSASLSTACSWAGVNSMGNPAVVAQVVERKCCHGGEPAIRWPGVLQVLGFHVLSFARRQLVTQAGCP
jgi:hypothetical protein